MNEHTLARERNKEKFYMVMVNQPCGMRREQLAKVACVSNSTAYSYLRELHAENRARIVDWEKAPHNTTDFQYAQLWGVGSGPHEPKPKIEKKPKVKVTKPKTKPRKRQKVAADPSKSKLALRRSAIIVTLNSPYRTTFVGGINPWAPYQTAAAQQ